MKIVNLEFAIRVYSREPDSKEMITQLVKFPDTLTEEQLIQHAQENVKHIIKNLLKNHEKS